MHTFTGEKATFHFSSDMSGDVQIVIRRGQDFDSLHVPGVDLIAFVAEYVRSQMISAVEQMSVHEVLGIPEKEIVDETKGPAKPFEQSSGGSGKPPRAVV